MSILDIVGGAFLLALGRRIFWLFVAAIGFFAGFELASRFLHSGSFWVTVGVALGFGVIGALLAYFAEKVAIGAAGFLVGAYLASRLTTLLSAQVRGWEWLVVLIGGLIGLVLMYALFEWTLIILSSLAGSILVANGLQLRGLVALVVGVVLFAVGATLQAGLNRHGNLQKRSIKS